MNCIETDMLTKYYGKTLGIDKLSLKVAEGEFFGFIGPNGAGKSTTIRTLLGLISPTSGSATVLGMPLSRSHEYRRQLGYMPGEAMLYSDMKVGELIKYSAALRHLDCSAESAKLCDILALDTKKRIGELSLGNRKKVSIVCAMQHKPKLYILDEPTSGLDPLMQKAFFELLHERRDEGATVFISSHVLSEVQHHCSTAAIIRNGKTVALDSVRNLAKTKTKRVILRGINALPDTIPAKSLSADGETVSFLYQGDIKLLISELDRLPITDMTVSEPELDEIFMHYYEGSDENADL